MSESPGDAAAPPDAPELQTATRTLLVLLLTGVASAIDVVGYVELGRVFTANMTGNTVLLGIALGRFDVAAITRSGGALVGYVLGVVVGALIVRRPRAAWSQTITAALALEALVLGAATAAWLWGAASTDGTPLQLALIAMLSLAMGLQSAAVNALAIAGVTTTYVSGTLTTGVTRLVHRLRREIAHDAHADAQSPWLTLAVWVVYLGTAIGIVGALSVGVWLALSVPLTAMLLVIVIALVRFR